MKNRKYYFFSTMFLFIFLNGCNLVDSNENNIEIILSSFILTENDSITVKVKNNSSELVLIYENNRNSRLQKKENDENWVRLVSQVVAFTDSYRHLEPGQTYTCWITQDYISGYTESIKGTYRVIFELVFNEDYQNQKLVISDEFKTISN